MTVVAHTSYYIGVSCLDRKPMKSFYNAWLYLMILEGARLLEMHGSVSNTSWMSHHE